MKLTLNKFYLIIIGILLIIIFFLSQCSGPKKSDCPPISKQEIKIDTLWTEKKGDIVYVPSDVKIIPGEIQYINGKVDTLAILKDYFAKVYYGDTIRLTTIDKENKKINYGYILVKDTISENRIKHRELVYDYKIPTIEKTITNTITTPNRNQFYAGLDMYGTKLQPINYFGVNLTLKNKKDRMYSIGAGITPGGIGYKEVS